MLIRFALSLLFTCCLIFSSTALAWKVEADTMIVNNTTGGTITSVSFRQTYSTAPLVFALPSHVGGDPAALRIFNVTTSGFDVYSVEPDGNDGPHAQMSAIPYIAIEPGNHELPDGTKIVAGTVSTQSFQSRLLTGASWHNVSLSGFVTSPVVLGQIQTRINESGGAPAASSQPWMTTKISNVNSGGFDIALERSETTTGSINANETIAYLAIDSGLNGGNHYFASNDADRIEYETIRSGNIIQGWSDATTTGFTVNFLQNYPSPIAVSSLNTRNNTDGGWLRRRNLTGSSIALLVDEDRANDAERSHPPETAGVLVFSEAFDAEFIYSGQAEMIINEIMYNETVTGLSNDEFVELYVTASGNLRGHVIADQDTNYYRFPSQSVSAGDYVIFHSGNGTDSSSGGVHHFYKGGSTIWNNPNDDVLLLRPDQDVTTLNDNNVFNAVPYDYVAYGRNSVGSNVDPIPTSMLGTTLSWNYSFGTELGSAGDGESISLTPNANDSNVAACWERTTSGNASDNSCSGYLPTVATNASFLNSVTNSNTDSPVISLAKTLVTIYDPYNGASNPKAIPGAVLEYVITAENSGTLATDNNSVSISDIIPNNTKLCVADNASSSCKAPYFDDPAPVSGLSLASIIYSDATSSITPSADSEGADDRIENIQASFNGAFPANSDFEFKFRVIVE